MLSRYDLLAGLIAFPHEELHHLLDVGMHEINAQHLAGVGSHADDDIYAANTIKDKETAVVTTNSEPSDAILHTSS
jgi:hypothetical protein